MKVPLRSIHYSEHLAELQHQIRQRAQVDPSSAAAELSGLYPVPSYL